MNPKKAPPPRYDEAFKAGAVRLVTEQGRPCAEGTRELGICIDTLRSWLKATGVQAGQTDRQNRDTRRQPSRRKIEDQTILRELVHLTWFPTRNAAQDAVFGYIEAYYNTVRSHSGIGWMSPAVFEKQFTEGDTKSCSA